MATAFERWEQTLAELAKNKAKPEDVEKARVALRQKVVEKARQENHDNSSVALALSRFDNGTRALAYRSGLVKEPDVLTEDERFGVNHPVLGGIKQAAKELVSTQAQGWQNIAGSALRLANDFGKNEKGTWLDQAATSMEDAQKSTDEFAGEGYATADGVRGFGKMGLQNAPILISTYLTGGAAAGATSLAGRAAGLAKTAQEAAKVAKAARYAGAAGAAAAGFSGEYGDARQQTLDKFKDITPEQMRESEKYAARFKAREKELYLAGAAPEDAAKQAYEETVDALSETDANIVGVVNSMIEFVAPGASKFFLGGGKLSSKSLANAKKFANLDDVKDVLKQFGQEFLQEGFTSAVTDDTRAEAVNGGVNWGQVGKDALVGGTLGAITGGGVQFATGESTRQRALEEIKAQEQQQGQDVQLKQAAQNRKAELDAIRQQRPLTPEEQDDADVADAIISRGAPQGQPVQEPQPQPGTPVDTSTQPPVEQPPAQPAPGLSGVVQRHTQSAAPSLDAAFSDAIQTGQSPDFTGLAQQTGIDRNSLVDQFNAKRTDHVRKQRLMDLAEQGDLNALRSAASEITVDPQQQDQLIEEAVAGNEKRKADALAASQQQGLQAQQQAQQSAQQQADKDKYDQTYSKMLDEAVAALEGGQTEVKAFLPIKKKYSASGLNATDVNGVIEHAKQVIAEKQQKAARHEQAVTEAMPHLQSGDEASAVLAMDKAGVTDDADVQSVLKEANKRIRQDSKKPAGTQSVPAGQQAAPVDPLSAAVAEVKAAQAAGKKVNLATIAKKHGVTIMDVAKGVVAKPEQAAPKAKPSQPLALPAPQGTATPGEVMVSRNGKVMSQAEADALDAAANAEKKQMRRDMAEEAGNPTGIPAGMRPKVEKPARTEQKAVLPDVILRTDGKPFPNEAEATRAMNRKGAQETHEVAPAPQGAGVVVKRKQANVIDVEKDDILAAIAKAGGVNWDQARKQGGFDPAESGRRGHGILRVFKKNGGMTLDGMAEHLSQFGYPVTDENGDYTVNALLDAMDTALRGGQVGTAQFNERLAREMYEKEAELRALDDALDGGSSSDMPSWLDDGADALAESVIDGETQPSAVLADALNEVENERKIASQAAGTGQEAESGAEAGAGQGGNAQAAGPREGGQQEGKGGAGQDPGVQAGFQLTAQTEAERLAEEQRQAADLEATRKEAEKSQPKSDATISDADYAQVVEAAKYLKDIVYSMDNLVGGDTDLLIALSSDLGKSGRDTILMDAFGIDRSLAHTINNRLDDRKPHKLRAVDMGDAFTTFPMLRKVVDDAKDVIRKREERRSARDAESKTASQQARAVAPEVAAVEANLEQGDAARITPEAAGDMKAGDIIKTSNGDEYVAMRARHDFMDAHPIVDGKPVVNRDSTVRFHLNPNTASAHPERNHAPIYKTGRNQYEEPVREMTEDGRAKDGKPIIGGDKFRTSSGRETTPYPHQKSEKYASQWLIDNATAEAEARGDDFNAPIFRRTTLRKNGTLTDADRDSMLMYLFGEQPKVVPSILKPLTEGGGKEHGDTVQRKFAELSELSGRSAGSIRDAYNAKAEEDGKDAADLSIDQEILRLKLEKARKDTPANKKFDSLIATAADSPAKLQEHGIERVLDNAESRTELVRLRDYLTSLRPDKAEFIADAANDIGGDKGFDMSGVAPKSNRGKQGNDQQKGEGESPQVSPNKVFTEDAAAKAREVLRKALLGNKPMSGMDPELFQAGVTLAGYHIEKGARTFAAYAKAMLNDLGESVRPYLKSWYMGVKYDPRASEMSGMSTASEVDGFDVGSVSIAPAVGIDSLQDYVVSEIEKNIKSLFPDGNAPKSVLEVESTDYSIDLVLQNHPAVRGRRDDPRAYKDFADAAKGIDRGAIREKIIGQREIEPFKAWQPATLKEENREVQGNDQYSGGGQKGDSARHEPSTGQRVVLAEQRPIILSDGQAGRPSGAEVGSEQEGGARLPVDRSSDAGKQGDQSIHREDGQFQPENGFAGDSESGGRSGRSDSRVHAERSGRPAVIRIAEQSGTDQLTTKRKLQRDAESIPVVVGDRENIDKTLPFLMDGQREDVHKAELRFSAKNGNGMLFTNGTGTGKTFLGLGIAKRFDRTGKGSGLIVVPNDEVMNEWVSSAPDLGLKITPLNDTKDKGDGIAITTYANLGQNDAISHRNYDFVIADEAHNLMQNADAEDTSALLAFRAITLHDSSARTLTDMRNRDLVNRRNYLNGAISSNNRIINNQDTMDYMVDELRKENAIMEAELNKLNGEYDQKLKDTQNTILTSAKPKAVFLSATPFAYEKNVRWAQGYLFDWNEGKQDENSSVRPYNAGSNYEQFMMQHFGYRMRYNKLTEPDAKVDRDLMQRQFNSYLKKSGSLSSRMLDVPSDYQRAFALTPNSIGTKIDEGLNWLREADDGRYRPIYDIVNERFDYLSRQRLLEAMKAQAVIPMIEQWHKIGKKVVVFYDFNSGGGFSPFDVGPGSDEKVMPGDDSEPISAKDLLAEFYAKRPDLKAINTGSLPDPLTAIRGAYPDAGVVNGLENRRNRNSALKDFNDDSRPDANLLLVQSAINAGWSAHDKSGKFKRVLINLGLPTAPTKAIQQEGRIYRQGQHPESDSMFVYLNTGTAWERIAFANTIARRASTAENLAMGESARGLKDAFIMAFEESDHLTPSTNEGKGSKARDRSLVQAISQFDRAKSYYFGTQKNSKTRSQREGSDYYATPEPVGLKMVEWLGLSENERALEPSAGHGAISRWLPDGTKNTIIEPSFDLLSRAALNTNAKQINGDFESLHLTNKFEGIVMNPPFGRGGSTAIEHLDKAFKHLSDNGRIVALIPRGGMADKRFAAWYEGIDSKGKQENPDAVLRASILLPEVTFERAGTKVSTRIVVIDKITDESLRAESGHQKQVDLSNASDIGDLFNRINDIAVPPRMKAKPQASADNGRTDGAGGALIATAETTHAIKKIPLYVAKMTRRVSADSYASLNAVAKRFGGYYSRYEKNGAIPGFQFESEDSRQKFIDAIGDQGQYGTPPSSPTPGVAEVSETGEYITSVGGQNERDTSSVQSRKRAYGSHSADAHDDLFAASAVPASESEAERNRTDFSKHFSTVSENLEQGRVKSPERITSHKEAAALFARWKDFSQERFLVAGLDANNKVVEVAVHTVGLKASASVDPGTVAGMVARNPSIKSVWLAHNHPSGSSAKSAADAQITRAISDLISAAGISVDGHIILGADSYTVLGSDGEALSRIPGMGEFDYQDAPATASVPLVDRMITKRDPGTKITGPDSAKKYVVDRGASGIVLMDTQLSVVGFWEMTLEQMGQMRQNQDSTRSLMAAIDASNAFNAIVSVPDEMADGGTAWKNVAAMLAASQISVVDAIGYKTGESYASRGLQVDQKGRNFYSVASATSGPGLTTSRAREILAADPVLSKAMPFIELKSATENIPAGAEPIGAEGYYHNGKITLFPENIKATPTQTAEERLKWVAFHEITHRGVANLAESQEYMAELQRAGKNPFIKNLAKKIYEKRQKLPPKYHVTMEVAIEEALAETWAALQTGSSKTIKEQYGLHFPLSIRPRAKSAIARFFEVVKRIYSKAVGRGLTNGQVADLLRRTNDSGMTPDGGPGRGRDYDAAVFSLADKGDGSPTEAALAEARRQLNEQLAIADRMIAERGGLFAPNGEKSKLNRYQWAQVRTANFKRWFGDWESDPAKASKVVDDNGEPLVVYHGTGGSFDAFDRAKGGSESGNDAGKKGHFLSGSSAIASDYALRARGGANVMPAFVALTNPARRKFRDIDQLDYWASINDFSGGLIADLSDGQQVFMVKDGSQIKSAIGNAGTFSGKTDDIRYSAPPAPGQPPSRFQFVSTAQQWMFEKWTKTLGTQLNTAMLEPLFKPTYDLVQRYLQHTNNDAYDAISVAPNLLGRLEDINDYGREIKNIGKFKKINADREAAAVPLFEGTRFDKKVYSDAVLKRVYNLTDDQVAVYREARAAIEASLDSHAKSVITKILLDAGAVEFSDIDTLVNRDLPADDYMEELRQRLDADILATNDAIAIQKTALSAAGVTAQDKASIQASIKKGSRRVELLEEAAKRIDSTENTLSQLKREGYFPLMRWGKYTVTVTDAGGKVVDFRMVETIGESKKLEAALTQQYHGQGMTVEKGSMSENRYKNFTGISPETLALFAKEWGVDNDDAYQEYLKLALPGQSALKRRIHRKGDNGEGIAGFSTDIQRTLAAFVMGNARHSARNIYGSAITQAVEAIPKNKGTAYDVAFSLAEFVTNPDENSTSVSIRNMLFIWNMGASVAFGALNLTQPWMMTLPWLSQFSGIGSVVELMGKAAKTAAIAQKNGTVPQEYYAEYQRAVREGHVDPQNVFMLQGIERGGSGLGSSFLKTLSHGMGMIAAATESYNRKLTLFAALDVARAKGLPWLKSKGFDSAYAFAVQAVAETQGVYNKGNRPAWARGPIGAVLLVFKQYAVNWIEMAVRMGRNHYGDDRMRKGLMMMLGLLFAMAGGMGMPFAEDLKDIAETAMGSAGKPVNIERQMQMTLGKGVADAVLAGPINAMVFNSLGLDMHGRMSMGNLIPGTGALNPYTSTDAKLSEGISVMGAGTGLLKKGSDAVAAAQDGRFLDAAQSAAPRAVESIMKGVRMMAEGKARDSRGNVLMETTPWDAAAKIIDFQPASVAITQRERGRRFRDKNIQIVARASLRNRLITAYEEKDAEKIRDAERALDEWNQDNPLYQIRLKKRDLRKAAKKRGSSWMKREETPKGLEWMDEYADQENGQ